MITGLGYAFTSGPAQFKRGLTGLLLSQMYRLAFLPAKSVVFQNPDDLNYFHALGILPQRVPVSRVWGSGVDLSTFAPQPLPKQPIFLMLARLLSEKGVREYIHSARIVKSAFPQAVFRLAGFIDSGPSAIPVSELTDWVRQGVVDYLGDLYNVKSALSACRFYVLPSYREGTPRSVLEALATARPVITTDVPGCRETVIHGRNGLLVPPRDSEALAIAMQRLIMQDDLLTEHMAQASLELARERFDVHKVNLQLMDVMGV
jgi:glycosyltransferase involved in cell wall biosynthesis